MNKLHAKSPCCGAAVSRFGGRRRRCENCGQTFRIRQKKRGRKRLRSNYKYLKARFLNQQPLIKLAYQKIKLSNSAKYKRFHRQLTHFVRASHQIQIPKGELSLILDGLWFRFHYQDWVLYVMAIKPIDSNQAYFLDPLLLPGKESLKHWQQTIETIPSNIKKRIIAYVCDGFSRYEAINEKYGWIQQRCHFHLLLHLQNVRGLRKKYWHPKHFREQIYQNIRQIITTSDSNSIPQLKRKLKRLSQHLDCPKRLKYVVREVLRKLDHFRSYIDYLDFNLPNTTNVIESMNQLLRQATNKLKTPSAVELWAIGYIRIREKLNCNGAKNQPN